MDSLGKTLIVLGLGIVGMGVILVFLPRMPFLGKLPGDIHIERGKFSFYFPITTSILASLLLSAVFWLFRNK